MWLANTTTLPWTSNHPKYNTGMQPACQAYRAVLAQLHNAPYAIQAAAFWAIEACYNQAWAKVLNDGTAEAYKEFAHRCAGSNVLLRRQGMGSSFAGLFVECDTPQCHTPSVTPA